MSSNNSNQIHKDKIKRFSNHNLAILICMNIIKILTIELIQLIATSKSALYYYKMHMYIHKSICIYYYYYFIKNEFILILNSYLCIYISFQLNSFLYFDCKITNRKKNTYFGMSSVFLVYPLSFFSYFYAYIYSALFLLLLNIYILLRLLLYVYLIIVF